MAYLDETGLATFYAGLKARIASSVPVMDGADGTNAGATGTVPAPSATENEKFLKGDGSWDFPEEVTTAQINTILSSTTTPVQVVSAELSDVLDAVYPVGSYYTSDYSTSPASLFGGTWERVNGRFLFGAGENEANTDETYGSMSAGTVNVSAGAMGGEATHRLLRAEIAEHYHLPMTESGEYGFVTTIATGDGFTRHTIASGSGAPNMVRSPNALSRNTRTGDVVNEHDLPHNNMPPYKAVYIWHRIA